MIANDDWNELIMATDWIPNSLGNHLDDDVFLEGLGGIESFHDSIRSGILDGGPTELDGLLEHTDDEVAVEEVLARLGIHQGQVVVVVVAALVARLADVQTGASGRNSGHVVVAVLRLVEGAVQHDAGWVVSVANAAQVCKSTAIFEINWQKYLQNPSSIPKNPWNPIKIPQEYKQIPEIP